MKKTFIYLFILLCFACRNKQEYTLCGTLYMDSNTVVDMLGIQMEDTLLYVKVDSAGYFSTTIPFREVVFCNLFGVAVTGEERWQFVTPVALQANASVDLDFHLTGGQTVHRCYRSGQPGIAGLPGMVAQPKPNPLEQSACRNGTRFPPRPVSMRSPTYYRTGAARFNDCRLPFRLGKHRMSESCPRIVPRQHTCSARLRFACHLPGPGCALLETVIRQ